MKQSTKAIQNLEAETYKIAQEDQDRNADAEFLVEQNQRP
jgi:hypothetical protein